MNKPHVPARPARARRAFVPAPVSAHVRLALVATALGGLSACGADAPSEPDDGVSVPIASLGETARPIAAPSGEGFGQEGAFDDGYLTLDEALAVAAASGLPATAAIAPLATIDSALSAVDIADGSSTNVPVGVAPSTSDVPAAANPEPVEPTEPVEPIAPAAPSTSVPTPRPDADAEPPQPEAPAPEQTSEPTQGVAFKDTPEDAIGEDTRGRSFASGTTEGFTGEVLDDGRVRVAWASDRTARGYNVYRGAKYVGTVFATEWVDDDTWDANFYYEIEAFDFVDNFTRIATGLTVPVRGTGRTDPEANLAGTPQLQDYALVFEEEFEGDSLNLDTWTTSYLWGDDLVINQEQQHYVDIENEPDFGFDPFEVADGSLTIKSIATPPELADKANGQPYLSGVITSYDGFKFTYGYAEARARVPYGQGLWSAFWLLNAYYGDDDPEIDIMEHLGDDQDVVYHTYHYYDGDELRSTKSHPVPGVDYTAGFHTYSVDWRPGLIVFYVDGKETHRITDPRVSDQEMYLIANTALGGWWPGSPDATTPFPASYEIDYIRVYQKNGPFDDSPVFDDPTSRVPYADAVLGASPNHRPPFELWPEGYPTR